MKIYDISLPISESLPTWPGDPPTRISQPCHLDRGDLATVSHLDIGAHAGTHVDAPAHFIKGGGGVDSLDLNVLVGPAVVVGAGNANMLSADVLDELSIPSGTERVLFHTRNSDLWGAGNQTFSENYVAVTEDGAKWLVDKGVRLVGVDYLSVAPFAHQVQTHKLLLEAGVVVVEGLNLSEIAQGMYQLVCLPLMILGSDGAPARAILVDQFHHD